ncbi:hypothetical protein AB0K18_09505 [Nonomuraea sp. NPDC049421]|uniref:hypothetical protein n=1 Tax=Nonomuraea sp. NPDC049421 TaxID=3155275 RepID=UPI0034151FD6
MEIMMCRRSSLAVAVLFAALTACSSDVAPAGARPGESAPPASASPSVTPSPSPTGPCDDGTCEVKVAVGDVVTVPERYGLGPIEVKEISRGSVEMLAPLTGPGYSVAGCAGGGSVSSAGGGAVRMSCDKGTVATINDVMSLEVVKAAGKTAVIRIEPAG